MKLIDDYVFWRDIEQWQRLASRISCPIGPKLSLRALGIVSVIEDRHVAPTSIVAQCSFFNIVIFMKHSNMLINYVFMLINYVFMLINYVLKVNSGTCLSLIFCGLNIR